MDYLRIFNFVSQEDIGFDYYFKRKTDAELKDSYYLQQYKQITHIKSVNDFPPGDVLIQYVVPSVIEFYKLHPDNLFMGFTKIGGLLALFKVSIFLNWLHKK